MNKLFTVKSHLQKTLKVCWIGGCFALVNFLFFMVWFIYPIAQWKSQLRESFLLWNDQTKYALSIVDSDFDRRLWIVYPVVTNLVLGILIQLKNIPWCRRTIYFCVWMLPAIWYFDKVNLIAF